MAPRGVWPRARDCSRLSLFPYLCALACLASLGQERNGFRPAMAAQFFATPDSSLTASATKTNGDSGRFIRHAARFHLDLANNSRDLPPANLSQLAVHPELGSSNIVPHSSIFSPRGRFPRRINRKRTSVPTSISKIAANSNLQRIRI